MSTAVMAENPRERIGGNNPPQTLEEMVEKLDLRLAEAHAAFAGVVEEIARRANEYHPKGGARTIEGLGDVEKVKAIILDAKAASKRTGQLHKSEKDPWLTGSRTVDGFFKKFDERLDRIALFLDGLIQAYQDKIERAEQLKRQEEERKRRAEEERQREIARKAEEEGRHAAAAKATQKAENAAAAADAAQVAQQRASEARTADDAFAGISAKKSWTFEVVDRSKIDLNKLAHWIPLADIEKALRGYVKANQGSAPLDGVRFFQTNANSYRA